MDSSARDAYEVRGTRKLRVAWRMLDADDFDAFTPIAIEPNADEQVHENGKDGAH